MNLSQNFTLEEMCHSQTAERLGLDNVPTPDALANLRRTAAGLETIRTLLGRPVVVSSGYRSPIVNRAVGGSPSSQHTKGQAADITVPGYGRPQLVMNAILKASSMVPYDQLILEYPARGGWVHVSFADYPRRQVLVIDQDGTRVYIAC